MLDEATLEEALTTLGELLANRGHTYELAAIGGAALLLLGYVDRPTKNLDIVALVQDGVWLSAKPFPEALEDAIADVAAALDLPANWLNPGPTSMLDFGLPEGCEGRVIRRTFGSLVIHLASRADHVAFKLYAAADHWPDHSRHSRTWNDWNPRRRSYSAPHSGAKRTILRRGFGTTSCDRCCGSLVPRSIMGANEIRDAAVELAWSLWSELGVPGVVRHHSHVAVDPEPLIVFTPRLFKLDARLRDQVFAWCATHSDRVSTSRLAGLLGKEGNDEFASFAAMLADHRPAWPLRDAGQRWPRVPDAASPEIPIRRPSLVLLRLRTLCGVGARADVLGQLLALRDQRLNARMLERLGYSKRNVASILAELAHSGIVTSSSEGNTRWFRLEKPEILEELVAGTAVSFWRWSSIFSVIESALTLASFSNAADSVRRVEANKIRKALALEAERLNLNVPPPTAGDPRAWDLALEWSVDHCQMLAAGQLV